MLIRVNNLRRSNAARYVYEPQPHYHMDSRFLLPVTIAAVLHASVFFGAKASHKTPVSKAPPAEAVSCTFSVAMEDPVVPDAAATDTAPKGSPDSPPQSPESFTREPSDFAQPVALTAPLPTLLAPTTIPLGPFGIPDGDPNLIVLQGPKTFTTGALDNPPRTRSQVAPVYPNEAKTDGSSAEVMVEFVVDENGRVVNPQIVRSTDRRFESATLRAVARWRFEPGTIRGKAVRFRMAAPVVFSLES